MTFGELKGLIASAIAEWTHSGAGPHAALPSHIGLWVQQAIYRLDADLMWTQERTVFDSDDEVRRYTLGSSILMVQYVTYAGSELRPLLTAEEIARQECDHASGTPTCYSWYGDELSLYPTPAVASDDIEVWAVCTPAAMSGDSDVPTLPLHTHSLLVDYALYQAFRHVGDVERMNACLSTYMAAMERERSSTLNSRGVSGARRDGRVV